MDHNFKNPIEKAKKFNKIGLAIAVSSCLAIGYQGTINTLSYSNSLKNEFSENFPYQPIDNIVYKRHKEIMVRIRDSINQENIIPADTFKSLDSLSLALDSKFSYFIPTGYNQKHPEKFYGYVASNMVKKTEDKNTPIRPEIATLNDNMIVYYSIPHIVDSEYTGTILIGFNISTLTNNMVKEFFALNIEHFSLEQFIEDTSTMIVANDYKPNADEKAVFVRETNWQFKGWNTFNYKDYLTKLGIHSSGYILFILLIGLGFSRWYRNNLNSAQRELQLFMEEVARDHEETSVDISYLLDTDPESKSLFSKDHNSEVSKTLPKKIDNNAEPEESEMVTELDIQSAEETTLFEIRNGIIIPNTPCPSLTGIEREVEIPTQGWMYLLGAAISQYFSSKGKSYHVAFEGINPKDLTEAFLLDGLAIEHTNIYKEGVWDKNILSTLIEENEVLIYIENSDSTKMTCNIFSNGQWLDSSELESISKFSQPNTFSNVKINFKDSTKLTKAFKHYQEKCSYVNELTLGLICKNENTRKIINNIFNDSPISIAYFENSMALQHASQKSNFQFGIDLQTNDLPILYTADGTRVSYKNFKHMLLKMAAHSFPCEHIIISNEVDTISEEIITSNYSTFEYKEMESPFLIENKLDIGNPIESFMFIIECISTKQEEISNLILSQKQNDKRFMNRSIIIKSSLSDNLIANIGSHPGSRLVNDDQVLINLQGIRYHLINNGDKITCDIEHSSSLNSTVAEQYIVNKLKEFESSIQVSK